MAANDDLLDAQLRHAIGIRRLTAGELKTILAMLDKSNAEIAAKLSLRLKEGDFTSERFIKLMRDIRIARKSTMLAMKAANQAGLIDLAAAEQEFSRRIMETILPVRFDYAVASAGTLRTLVTAEPFSGGANAARTLGQWWDATAAADQGRILSAIQQGMIQEETVPQMVNRAMAGTELTRNNAVAVVRTAVNHVSNASREAFFTENTAVVQVLRWTATLDGRTSAVCRGRDGHHTTVQGAPPTTKVPPPKLLPQMARPPAHPSCRSIMTAVLNPNTIEEAMPRRPFVRDTRTRKFREKDFRAEAHARVGNKRWKKMTVQQRNNAIKRNRRAWTKENVGTVPGLTNYDTWLRKQPRLFQDEVLGKAKGVAFRKGLKLDKFIDKKGGELTLLQLQEKYPTFVTGGA